MVDLPRGQHTRSKGQPEAENGFSAGRAKVPPPPGPDAPVPPPPPPAGGSGKPPAGKIPEPPAGSGQAPGSSPLKPLALAGAVILGLALLGFLSYWGLGLLRGGGEVSLDAIETAAGVNAQGRALKPTGTFPSDTPVIYVSLEVSGAPRGTVLTSQWYREPLHGEEQLLARSSSEVPPGDSALFFRQAAPPAGWSGGSYRVELGEEDEILGIARFWIQESPGSQELDPGHSASGEMEMSAPEYDRLHQDLGEWLYTDRGHRGFVLLPEAEVPGWEEFQATYGPDELVWAYGVESIGSHEVTVLLGIPHGETLARIKLQRHHEGWLVTSYEDYGPGAL